MIRLNFLDYSKLVCGEINATSRYQQEARKTSIMILCTKSRNMNLTCLLMTLKRLWISCTMVKKTASLTLSWTMLDLSWYQIWSWQIIWCLPISSKGEFYKNPFSKYIQTYVRISTHLGSDYGLKTSHGSSQIRWCLT